MCTGSKLVDQEASKHFSRRQKQTTCVVIGALGVNDNSVYGLGC